MVSNLELTDEEVKEAIADIKLGNSLEGYMEEALKCLLTAIIRKYIRARIEEIMK